MQNIIRCCTCKQLYLQTQVTLQMLYVRTQVTLQWNICDARMFYMQEQITCTMCESKAPAKRVHFIQHHTTLMFYEMLHSFGHLVVSCCILLYEVWSRSNFSLNKCCTIQRFFCFSRCCTILYSFGHAMQLCCTLLYSNVRSRSSFPATFLCWLCFQRHV